MDLFLVPNNPEQTVLVSANGVAHYQVSTSKTKHGARISSIRRPAETQADSFVAEIEWKKWDSPTAIRSPLLKSFSSAKGGVLASEFLYKRGQFSSTRYFIGDDGLEYKWKVVKGVGCVLSRSNSAEEVARFVCTPVNEGFFAGEKKTGLRVHPSSLDIDLIILSFIVVEKKRRDHAGDETRLTPHTEDPQGEGGSGEGGAG